jgi:hypothetical protein
MSIQHRSHDRIGAKTSCKIGTYPTLFQHLTNISNCLTKCSCGQMCAWKSWTGKVSWEFEGPIWPSPSLMRY